MVDQNETGRHVSRQSYTQSNWLVVHLNSYGERLGLSLILFLLAHIFFFYVFELGMWKNLNNLLRVPLWQAKTSVKCFLNLIHKPQWLLNPSALARMELNCEGWVYLSTDSGSFGLTSLYLGYSKDVTE